MNFIVAMAVVGQATTSVFMVVELGILAFLALAAFYAADHFGLWIAGLLRQMVKNRRSSLAYHLILGSIFAGAAIWMKVSGISITGESIFDQLILGVGGVWNLLEATSILRQRMHHLAIN